MVSIIPKLLLVNFIKVNRIMKCKTKIKIFLNLGYNRRVIIIIRSMP